MRNALTGFGLVALAWGVGFLVFATWIGLLTWL
jgi:hypothetical protein